MHDDDMAFFARPDADIRCCRQFVCWTASVLLLHVSCAFGASGEAVYRAKCSVCHDSGAGHAPRIGIAADWTERFALGRAALHEAAIKGLPGTAMAPKGGFADLSEAEVGAAVDHILQRTAYVDPPAGAATPKIARAAPAANAIETSLAQPADDASLAAQVAEALRDRVAPPRSAIETFEAERIVRGLGIRVSAQGGVVRLMGVVQNAAVVKRAEEVARSVAGVRGLDNRLVTGGMLDFD